MTATFLIATILRMGNVEKLILVCALEGTLGLVSESLKIVE